MTFRGDPSWLADALAGTPKKATSIVQLVLDDHTSVVGTQVGSFSRFYLNGVQVLPADGSYTVNPSANFRVLKAFASISNPTGAVARVTYYCHRSAAHHPGLPLTELCINTIHIAPGGVENIETSYDAETDALVLGGTELFEPLFGLFSDTAGLKIDLNYLCATFPGTQNTPAPSGGSGGLTPHPTSTIVQQASTVWGSSGAPAPTATITFPNPVAVGDLIAVAIGFGADAIDHVSGCGSSAWSIVQSFANSGQNYTAAIAWFQATTAGTTVSIAFNPAGSVNGGHAVAWQINGCTTLATSANMLACVGPANHQTPPLDATTNEVYVGVTTRSAGGGVLGYTESPAAFTATYDQDSPDNNTWIHSGIRIASAIENISRTTRLNGGTTGISVAALFV